jgi:HlyD family secretion protein
VQYRVAEPGEVLPAGGVVLNLVDLADVYMTFFLPSAVAGRVAIGSEARIVLDAAPQFVIPAVVSFVAAEAQFTPKYVETAAERDKLVYRVKLQVPREVAQRYSRYVKAGLTGYGHVRTDARTPWPASLQVRLPDVSEASPAASR